MQLELKILICTTDMRKGTEPSSTMSKSVHVGGTDGNHTRHFSLTLDVVPLAKLNMPCVGSSLHSSPCWCATLTGFSIALREPMARVQPRSRMQCVALKISHGVVAKD